MLESIVTEQEFGCVWRFRPNIIAVPLIPSYPMALRQIATRVHQQWSKFNELTHRMPPFDGGHRIVEECYPLRLLCELDMLDLLLYVIQDVEVYPECVKVTPQLVHFNEKPKQIYHEFVTRLFTWAVSARYTVTMRYPALTDKDTARNTLYAVEELLEYYEDDHLVSGYDSDLFKIETRNRQKVIISFDPSNSIGETKLKNLLVAMLNKQNPADIFGLCLDYIAAEYYASRQTDTEERARFSALNMYELSTLRRYEKDMKELLYPRVKMTYPPKGSAA